MKTFDQNKNRGLVYGLPGVAYEQDGAFFALDGTHIVDPQEVEEPTKKKVTKYDVESQRAAGKRVRQD